LDLRGERFQIDRQIIQIKTILAINIKVTFHSANLATTDSPVGVRYRHVL